MVSGIHGWVVRKREHGKIAFLDLRTVEFPGELLQAVFKEDVCGKEVLEKAKKISLESCLILEGEIKENPKAPSGKEILVKEMKIVSESEPFPLGPKEHGVEAIMKYRHLAVRLPKFTKIWVVREKILKYLRETWEKYGYHEVSPPIIIKTACEGGATLFKVEWFDKETAYLSQSAQLYLEALIFSLGKVWSLTPSFRAEKSRTRRHLAEYWHFEWEAAFYHHKEMMDEEEKMFKEVIQKLLEDKKARKIIKEFRGEGLKVLEKSIEEKWPRIKYDEVIEILQKKGVNIKWGDDLGADEERILTMDFETPIFVIEYPKEIKAFYMKWKDGKVVENHDILAPEGYGEIVGGSERESDIEKMKKLLEIQEGIKDFSDYEWYFDLRRYGNVYHSGAGLGVERFLMWILRLDHIRDAIPFPRLAREKKFI